MGVGVEALFTSAQVLEFQAAAGDADRYAWIEAVIKRFD